MKEIIKSYFSIAFGCFVVSVGFVFFINPYKFVPGGVYGSSIVLHNIFPVLQVGTFSYMISIPLLLLSYFVLGKRIGARTLFATLMAPLFMNTLSALAYPTTEALQRLSPTELCGGILNLSDNLILAVIIGSVLIGVGESFIMMNKATSGGSDIVAMILNKYFRVRFSSALLSVDAIVVGIGLLVLGLGVGAVEPTTKSWMLSGYSLICIFLMTKTLAYVISGTKNNKLMFIVTDKNHDQLRHFIIHTIDRTATLNESRGLYAGGEKTTYMMVVQMRQVDPTVQAIKAIDPEAFVIVTDAYDAYGKRWTDFPDKQSVEVR